MRNILFITALITLVVSCKEGGNKFFDLDKAYSADIKINLDDLRQKINSELNNQKAQIDSLPADYAKSRLDKVISLFGFVDSYSNGEKIDFSDCPKIKSEIYKNLSSCIILDDCPKDNSTDFCTEKRNTFKSLNSIDLNYHRFAVTSSSGEFMTMYYKKYITKAELDFLILNMYLVVSLNNIE